jgi:amino acid adenylation domain-containing protein
MQGASTAHRLSPQQERLWPWLGGPAGVASYGAHVLVELEGELDRAALGAALAALVGRHELLRTAFAPRPGESAPPAQVVSGHPAPVRLALHDLSGLAAADQQRAVEALFSAALAAPCDLARPPLLRATLATLAPPRRHLLLLGLPALLADAAGLDNLVRELVRAYGAAAGNGRGGAAAAAPGRRHADDDGEVFQYVDLAEWQHDLLTGEGTQEGRDYWKRWLAASPACTPASAVLHGWGAAAIPSGPDPAVPGAPARDAARFAPAMLPIALQPRVAASAAALAATLSVAPATVLLAAWYVVLWRLAAGGSTAGVGSPPGGSNEGAGSLPGSIGGAGSLPGSSGGAGSLPGSIGGAGSLPSAERGVGLVVGVTFDGRRFAEVEGALGLFARDLPVAARLDEALLFAAAAERLHQVCGDHHDWQEYWAPGALASGGAAPAARPVPPFYPLACERREVPARASAGGLAWTPRRSGVCRGPFALKLVHGWPEAPSQAPPGPPDLELHYDASQVPAFYARLLAERFATLLGSAAERPSCPIGDLEMLGPEERRQLAEWNATDADFPGAELLHRLFEEQAARTPGLTALRWEGGEMSYAELDRRAQRLAGRLRRLGVGPEARVAVCVERSAEMVVGLLAVLKAGGAYVPLDPAYPPERLAFILESAAPLALLAGAGAPPALTRAREGLPVLELAAAPACAAEPRAKLRERVGASPSPPAPPGRDPAASENREGDPRGVAGGDPIDLRPPSPASERFMPRGRPPQAPTEMETGEAAAPALLPDHPASVFYTSGSTGRPKGVVAPHRAIVNRLLWMQERYPFAPGDRVLQKTPYGFDASVWEIFSPLIAGAELVMARPQGHRDTAYLAAAVAAHRITVLQLVPSVLAPFLEEPGVTAACASLKRLFCGGEELTPALARRCLALLDAELCNVYGPTEAVIDCITWLVPRDPPPATVPIGHPLANVRAYLLDSGWRSLPLGVAGELCLGGQGLARGYLDRPDLTAARFVPDPCGGRPGARLYRTGDLARHRPDGALEHLGRIDDQIKLRGVRIELGEIESRLARHPAVREAAVAAARDPIAAGVDSTTGGNGGNGAAGVYNHRLIACLVLRPGTAPADEELRAWVAAALPEAMVPSVFVARPALPRLGSGKVDRQAIVELAPRTAAAAATAPGRGSGSAAPRTPTEELLASRLAELLEVERVGPDDNLFALGWHSLLATRLASRLRSLVGVSLPLHSLFEQPTVASLAARVDAALRGGGAGREAPPIVPLAGPRDRPLPLSFAQRRLWFIDRWQPDSSFYNIPLALRLAGPLDARALARSLGEIVRRHETLRSRFAEIEDEPAVLVAAPPADPAAFALPLVDLGGLPEAPGRLESRRLLAAAALRPFDLARGPLLRCALLRLGDREHVGVLTLHHIVSDGWSTAILTREIGALYAACARPSPRPGPAAALPELAIQYADFAAWQRGWLQGEVLEGHLDYWRRRLAGAPPVLALPTDRPRPAVQSFRGDTRARVIAPEVVAALRAVARRDAVTLFMAAVAAGQAMLGWFSGQDDVLVGTDIAGRNHAEIEGLIGFFVNQLALRTHLAGDPSFRSLLAAVRETTVGAYAHQDLPFDKLVEALNPERSRQHAPLLQVKINLHNEPPPALDLAGLTLTPLQLPRPTAQIDWLLNLQESDAGMIAAVEYATDLFDPATIDRMLGSLEALLRAVGERVEARLGELAAALLTPAERDELLAGAPPVGFAEAGSCIHQLFAAQAAATPDRVAVRGTDASLTYAELGRRACQLARRLAGLGAGPERLVAVWLERSPEMMIALLGILEAGAAYVPLDPDHPGQRVAAILADTAPAAIVSRRSLLGLLPGGESAELPILCLDGGERDAGDMKRRCDVAVVDYSKRLSDRPPQPLADPLPGSPKPPGPCPAAPGGKGTPPPSRAPKSFFLDRPESLPGADADGLAYVMYTSGSTGRPKGVMASHRAVVNRLLWMQGRFPFAAGDRVLQKTPYGFDASVWEIFSPLLAGAELVMARPQGHRDTAYLAEAVATHGITVLQLVPSVLAPLLDEPGVAAACASLRRLVCGGEELTPALARRCLDLLAAELCNVYGPTEAVIDCIYWLCPRQPPPAAVPIGRPLANVEAVLVDARLAAVPWGVAGELLIGGVGLARGYLGRPDLTAERFVPHPFSRIAGARLYRTGDLARRLPGGDLEYLGRLDRQVKLRGVRVEPREIEALLAAYPGVRQAAVVVRGEGADRRLVAYVARGADHDAGDAAGGRGAADVEAAAELRAYLARCLPASMVPGAVLALRELPLTPYGKLDLLALPDPGGDGEGAEGAAGAARTATEQLLADIWAEVLGRGQVGVEESFFALGGHSLAVTRVLSRVRRTFGVEPPVQSFFAEPTVAGLAREVDAAVRAGHGLAAPPFARLQARQDLPLSFAQQRLWFLEQLRPGTALYNITDAIGLRGSLDLAALAAALNEIVRRHEALRTTFPSVRGTPLQRIHEPAPLPLPLIDLAGLPADPAHGGRAREAARWLAWQRDQPFDLARWPLLRVLVVRLGPGDFTLLFTVHHIVSDAWSSGVLLREVAALSGAAAARRPSPLPELPYQYADFASWQRGWLQGEALAGQLAYWRRQLAGAPPLLELPADRPRPAAPTLGGATRPVLFAAPLADGLRALGRRHGVTLFMTLLAAFNVLLRHLLGPGERDDIVVGTDIANRNRAETEGVIGFFINQMALRSDLSGDPAFAELLARERALLLDAYAHQDVPFDLVVDALEVPRSLRHHPLFQVKLFLENTPAAELRLPGLRFTPLEVEDRAAKLDLTLALWEKPEGLVGWLNWSTDLFDAPRMARLMRQMTTLAAVIAARPDARLSELDAVLADLGAKERTMEKRELKSMGARTWKTIQPRAVSLPQTAVVERSTLTPGSRLPLVIRPLVGELDLADWAAANAAEIESDLLRHGAILFRGFGIDTPQVFEGFARTLCPDLFNENGEHPRETVSGNVYTPVFYPPDQRLLWHNENSFNWSWPRKIFFCCVQPAEQGGETPIVDSRRVYEEIDGEVRERFAGAGVLYQRNFADGLGLPWQTVFQAETREEVERQCLGSRVRVEWREGGSLRTRAVRPAIVRHPESGELSWFNQAQHWHVSCLDDATRRSMRSLFADADLPRHCYFGDGQPIADEHMQAVLAAYQRLEVSFPWQRGDVLLVDNVLTAHGRNPFKGPRKLLVAMGQMTSYEEV